MWIDILFALIEIFAGVAELAPSRNLESKRLESERFADALRALPAATPRDPLDRIEAFALERWLDARRRRFWIGASLLRTAAEGYLTVGVFLEEARRLHLLVHNQTLARPLYQPPRRLDLDLAPYQIGIGETAFGVRVVEGRSIGLETSSTTTLRLYHFTGSALALIFTAIVRRLDFGPMGQGPPGYRDDEVYDVSFASEVTNDFFDLLLHARRSGVTTRHVWDRGRYVEAPAETREEPPRGESEMPPLPAPPLSPFASGAAFPAFSPAPGGGSSLPS